MTSVGKMEKMKGSVKAWLMAGLWDVATVSQWEMRLVVLKEDLTAEHVGDGLEL